jgi:hypothetical protein
MQAPLSHRFGFRMTIRFFTATLALWTATAATAREANPFADFIRKMIRTRQPRNKRFSPATGL